MNTGNIKPTIGLLILMLDKDVTKCFLPRTEKNPTSVIVYTVNFSKVLHKLTTKEFKEMLDKYIVEHGEFMINYLIKHVK